MDLVALLTPAKLRAKPLINNNFCKSITSDKRKQIIIRFKQAFGSLLDESVLWTDEHDGLSEMMVYIPVKYPACFGKFVLRSGKSDRAERSPGTTPGDTLTIATTYISRHSDHYNNNSRRHSDEETGDTLTITTTLRRGDRRHSNENADNSYTIMFLVLQLKYIFICLFWFRTIIMYINDNVSRRY